MMYLNRIFADLVAGLTFQLGREDPFRDHPNPEVVIIEQICRLESAAKPRAAAVRPLPAKTEGVHAPACACLP